MEEGRSLPKSMNMIKKGILLRTTCTFKVQLEILEEDLSISQILIKFQVTIILRRTTNYSQ